MDPHQELADQFLDKLDEAMMTMRRNKTPNGLRPMEMGILRTLYAQRAAGVGELTPSRVSSLMGAHHPAVSATIAGLEKAGCITRRHSQDDRRKVLLAITERGIYLTEEHLGSRRAEACRMISFLGEEDSRRLIVLIGQVGHFYSDLAQEPDQAPDEKPDLDSRR